MNILSTYLVYLYMLVAASSDNAYQKAEALEKSTLATSHQVRDTFVYCEEKMKAIILKDTIINKAGGIGTEYNYPIYKFETEINYYKDMKIASIEKKEIHLKRFQYNGVTSGIQITTTIDSLNSYYFDQEQNQITYKKLLVIKDKICKDKGN